MRISIRSAVPVLLSILLAAPIACGGNVDETIDPCPTDAPTSPSGPSTGNGTPSPPTGSDAGAPAPTNSGADAGAPAPSGSNGDAGTPPPDAGSTTPGTCTPRTLMLQVPSTVAWTDTGLDVTAGSVLDITATGTPRYGTEDPKQVADANGGDYLGTQAWDDDVLAPPTITEALIGKVGGTTDLDTGAPVPEGTSTGGAGFVGTTYRQTMTDSGRLYLGYNDQRPNFFDNSGAFSVAVTVTCPAPTMSTNTVDPEWQRTNEHFLAPAAPNPNLQYYAANTYPLYNDDDTAAGAAFTWTTSAAWNGPSATDMPVDGGGAIPGFVADDTWFWTYDRVGDGVTGTTYWFRANVNLGPTASLASVTLADKYHPGRIAVNDGCIVFIDGIAQPTVLSVSAVQSGTGITRDDTETGWSFDGLSLSPSAFHDGSNEIAVQFEERFGDGGLGHLELTVATQP